MDPPYDIRKRRDHAWEALDDTPIGHPMYKPLSAEVDLHTRIHALARRPPAYWTNIPHATIKERIDTLVYGDWRALMNAPGDPALLDRVQSETEWLFRCIITAARVRDGDETQERFDALWAAHNAELDHEKKKRTQWGSSFFHTSHSGRRLRTPDEMFRDRSSLRYSSYESETKDLLSSAEDAGHRRQTRSMRPDPEWDQAIASDSARLRAHLQIMRAPPRTIPPSQYDATLEELRDAWYALLENPRGDARSQRVQLLTDELLLAFGPNAASVGRW